MESLEQIKLALSSPLVLTIWLTLAIISVAWVIRDLYRYNAHIMSLMKGVWILTVLYSGPVGLAIYYFSGRRQIKRDSIWRKGFRSVAHCYSGCGAGEVSGVLIAAGLLSLGNLGISLLTLALAYIFGFGMTMGPLIQSGVAFKDALIDTFYSDMLTIAVMEAVAIGVDLWLSSSSRICDVLFWSSLIVSLSIGLIAAYPVNVWLIKLGIKGGMGDPRESHHHH